MDILTDSIKDRIRGFFDRNKEMTNEYSKLCLTLSDNEVFNIKYYLTYSVENGYEHTIFIIGKHPLNRLKGTFYSTEHPYPTLDEAFRMVEKQIERK